MGKSLVSCFLTHSVYMVVQRPRKTTGHSMAALYQNRCHFFLVRTSLNNADQFPKFFYIVIEK